MAIFNKKTVPNEKDKLIVPSTNDNAKENSENTIEKTNEEMFIYGSTNYNRIEQYFQSKLEKINQ